MDKRSTGLLGTLVFVFGSILALGSALRALDYLVNAEASAMVQSVASALLYPPVAVLLLFLGVGFGIKAWLMPRSISAEPGENTGRRLEPNMVVLGTSVMPVDRNLQPTGPDSAARGAIIRFRNDAHATKEVGVMLGTRAQLELTAEGMTPLHVDGIWSDEGTMAANFLAGDTHDLIVAVRVNGEVSVPEVRGPDGKLLSWNVSAMKFVNIKVRLLGGLERTIVREFNFRLEVQPEFRVKQMT
jgi:hypothetical protein